MKILPSMLDVYLVTDRLLAGDRREEDIVREALQAGVRLMQYREKELSTRRQMERASRLCRMARQYNAVFLVNDRVDIAMAVGADGVHLGQDDLPLLDARRLLGPGKIIGVSVQNREEARRAQEEGADYLGVSAVFPTSTKEEASAIGLEGLKDIRQAVNLPLVAIGGINLGNAAEVIQTGMDGIAVVSAIVCAADVRDAASRLLAEVRRAKKEESRC